MAKAKQITLLEVEFDRQVLDRQPSFLKKICVVRKKKVMRHA